MCLLLRRRLGWSIILTVKKPTLWVVTAAGTAGVESVALLQTGKVTGALQREAPSSQPRGNSGVLGIANESNTKCGCAACRPTSLAQEKINHNLLFLPCRHSDVIARVMPPTIVVTCEPVKLLLPILNSR